ncbi:hypothetical protein [uncultured Acetatifactor sp.]
MDCQMEDIMEYTPDDGESNMDRE